MSLLRSALLFALAGGFTDSLSSLAGEPGLLVRDRLAAGGSTECGPIGANLSTTVCFGQGGSSCGWFDCLDGGVTCRTDCTAVTDWIKAGPEDMNGVVMIVGCSFARSTYDLRTCDIAGISCGCFGPVITGLLPCTQVTYPQVTACAADGLRPVTTPVRARR